MINWEIDKWRWQLSRGNPHKQLQIRSSLLVLTELSDYAQKSHYDDVIMTTMASQITSLTTVYSIVYSGIDQTGTGEFPAQRASYAENVSIWWRYHECCQLLTLDRVNFRNGICELTEAVHAVADVFNQCKWVQWDASSRQPKRGLTQTLTDQSMENLKRPPRPKQQHNKNRHST